MNATPDSNTFNVSGNPIGHLMHEQRRYEVLDGLPTYGPMYVPVSESGEPFYSEGCVVRFFKSDGREWVANFKPGWTSFSLIVDYPEINQIVVIAKGQGYIMTPDQEMPIDTFGVDIRDAIKTADGKIVLVDDLSVRLLDHEGAIWQLERISWDGIKDVKLQDHILTGLSYDPMDSIN
ncbi:MAG: hypothetical protein EOP48_12135, partial [Sphingobacteriales bacterium]